MVDQNKPEIINEKITPLSKWSTLITKKISFNKNDRDQIYHSFSLPDYVSVLAYTAEKKICLVKQYRPALDEFTYELPGGLRENNDNPEKAIKNELYEETGMKTNGPLNLLGIFKIDTGRIKNDCYAYSVKIDSIVDTSWVPEKGIQSFLIDADDLLSWINNGKFNYALHISIFTLAKLNKII